MENRTQEEQLHLCILNSVMVWVPFTGHNDIYDYCEKCEFGDLFLRGFFKTPDMSSSVCFDKVVI